MTNNHKVIPQVSPEIPEPLGASSEQEHDLPDATNNAPGLEPNVAEAPLVALHGHPISPHTPSRPEIPTPVDPHERKKGLSRRATIVAAITAFVMLAGGVGIAIGFNRKTSAEPAVTPAASAPVTPGNTTSAAPSETATSSPSASAETTNYVRKNNLLQVSDGGSYEKWGIPGAAKVTSLINAAKTPAEAVVAAKTADKVDIKSYVESWVYGKEAEKTNDFIDQVYTIDPKAFPKSLIDRLNLSGPGKEVLQDPEAIVNDFNMRLLIASRIAQDETIPKTDREKIVAVILTSLDAPNITPNLNESVNDAGPNYSYLYSDDYQKILAGFMDRKPGEALRVAPLLVVNASAQYNLTDPALTANMNILVDGKVSTLKVDVEVVAVNIYNDAPEKKPAIIVVINTKYDGSSFNFEQIAKFVDTGKVPAGNVKAMVANLVNKDTKGSLFTNVAVRTTV